MDRCTKNLAESERWWGGLDLWEEQSPIDKKLLFFQRWQGGANQFRKRYLQRTQSPCPFITIYSSIERLVLIK